MDEHPFWEWYLYSCPQFYVTVESAALALSHHYAAFHRLVVHEADAHALCLDLDEVLHGKRRTDRQKRINQLLLHVL